MNETGKTKQLTYQIKHTTRSVSVERSEIYLDTKKIYDGTNKDTAQQIFCDGELAFGESMELLVFENGSDEKTLVHHYERNK